ncbi:MAG: putative metal-dependent hydrolase [Candidatus Paceibacteria bacterium]|jgi:predicted metal-dependent hydrolase
MISRTILISKTLLSYELKKSKRAKRTNITMHPDGRMVVTIPWFATHLAAERLMKSKRDWILKNLKNILKRNIKMVPAIAKKDFSLYKNKALEVIQPRVNEICELHGFKYNKIFIKNHKSQWGSCSSLGNLNFNIKLMFLPDHLIEYIIIHEICHLVEQNHSNRFWDLVGKFVDYKKCNRDLKEYVIS